MKRSYLDYAMSVIVGRALPDVRDGLKPVHRRILYAMYEHELHARPRLQQVGAHRRRRDRQVPPARRRSRSTTRSCAWRRTSRCATPLIDGQGNFGSVDGDPPAAHALHRGELAHVAIAVARRSRQGHRRLQAELRREAKKSRRPAGALSQSARQRRGRHRRRHGDQHPAAQSRRDDRRRLAFMDKPDIDARRVAGASFPGPTFRPAASILGEPASAPLMRPAAARSSCAPRSRSKRCARTARR